MLYNNSATIAGGALWVGRTTVEANNFTCTSHIVDGGEASSGQGGCLAAFDSTVAVSGSTWQSNQVIGGQGGDVFLDCSTAANLVTLEPNNSTATFGSSVFTECYDAERVQLPSSLDVAEAVESDVARLDLVDGPRPLVNSIAATIPVAVFHLQDAFGAFRWEDSFTACTVAVTGSEGKEAALLMSSRFVATSGTLTLFPFAVLAQSADTYLILRLTCPTSASNGAVVLTTQVTVPLTAPVIEWVAGAAVAYPSDRTATIHLEPILSVRILITGRPTNEISSFLCSVTSGAPELGFVVGVPTGTANGSLITFPRVGISAPLGTNLPLVATCQLPSGASFSSETPARVITAAVSFSWSPESLKTPTALDLKYFVLASENVGSEMIGLRMFANITSGSATDKRIACSTQVVVSNASFVAASLLKPAKFDIAAVREVMDAQYIVPPLRIGIQTASPIAAPEMPLLGLQVQCLWNSEVIASDLAIMPILPMSFEWIQPATEESGIIPSLEALYNTPLPNDVVLQWTLLIQKAAANGGAQSGFDPMEQSVSCELTANTVDGGGVVLKGPGATGAWIPRTGTVSFDADLRLLPTDIDAKSFALQPLCIVNELYSVKPSPLSVHFLNISLHVQPASTLLLPSASLQCTWYASGS